MPNKQNEIDLLDELDRTSDTDPITCGVFRRFAKLLISNHLYHINFKISILFWAIGSILILTMGLYGLIATLLMIK